MARNSQKRCLFAVMRCISNHSQNHIVGTFTSASLNESVDKMRARQSTYIHSICSAFECSKPQILLLHAFYLCARVLAWTLANRQYTHKPYVRRSEVLLHFERFRHSYVQILFFFLLSFRIHTCVKFWTFSVGETVFVVVFVVNIVVLGDAGSAVVAAAAASTDWADSYESLSLLFIAMTDGVNVDVVNLATAVAISVDDAESLITIFCTISLLCLSLVDSVLLSQNWIKSTGICCWDDILDEFLSLSLWFSPLPKWRKMSSTFSSSALTPFPLCNYGIILSRHWDDNIAEFQLQLSRIWHIWKIITIFNKQLTTNWFLFCVTFQMKKIIEIFYWYCSMQLASDSVYALSQNKTTKKLSHSFLSFYAGSLYCYYNYYYYLFDVVFAVGSVFYFILFTVIRAMKHRKNYFRFRKSLILFCYSFSSATRQM